MCIKTLTASNTATAMDLMPYAMRNVSVIVSFYQENEALARGVTALEPLEQTNEVPRPD